MIEVLVSDLWVAGVVDCVVGDRFLVKSIPPSLAFDPDGAWLDREGARWRWPVGVVTPMGTVGAEVGQEPAETASGGENAQPEKRRIREGDAVEIVSTRNGWVRAEVSHLATHSGRPAFRPRYPSGFVGPYYDYESYGTHWRWPVGVVTPMGVVGAEVGQEPIGSVPAAALAQVEIVPAKRPSEADAIRAERARVWKAAEVAGAAEHAARTAAHCPMTALHDLAETCSWGADVVKAGLPHLEARELFFDELSEDPRWDPVAVSVAKDLSDRHVFEIIRNAEGLGDPNAPEGKCGVQSLEWARLIHLSVGEQRKTMVRAANLHTETLGRFLKACACALGDSNVQAAEGGAQ